MKTGFTFADVVDHIILLDVLCKRCNRHGRYRLDRLIEQYGAGAPIFWLSTALAEACPQSKDAAIYSRCDIMFPQLAELFKHGKLPATNQDLNC